MVLVNFAVKRILYANYQQETYSIKGGQHEIEIENKLKNDKNVVDFYRID
jgi:hypothetical protein